jgi:hypothetical protein
MGVKDPTKSVKSGGVVGSEVLEVVVDRFLRSARSGYRCPATESVVRFNINYIIDFNCCSII